MSRAARVAAILVLAAILLPALVSACPLCKDAEADTPGGTRGFGLGIYYSILLMIAVPWTAVGTVAFLIFRRRRRERATKERQNSVAGISVAGAGPQGLSPQLTPTDLSPRLSPGGVRS
ncbi:MAG TPA: hypothetical protein VK392_03230 [Thermoanaerobaculia bacterium]|nr:hypothetical protein [Thermoanaerobaculia bacterium]